MSISLGIISRHPIDDGISEVEYSDTRSEPPRNDLTRWKSREKGARSEERRRVGPSHGVSRLLPVLSPKTNVLVVSGSLLRSKPLVRVCVCVGVWRARARGRRTATYAGTSIKFWASHHHRVHRLLSSRNVESAIEQEQLPPFSRSPREGPNEAHRCWYSGSRDWCLRPHLWIPPTREPQRYLLNSRRRALSGTVFSARRSKGVCIGLDASVCVLSVRVTAGTRGGASVRDSGNGDATAIAYQWGPGPGTEEGPREA